MEKRAFLGIFFGILLFNSMGVAQNIVCFHDYRDEDAELEEISLIQNKTGLYDIRLRYASDSPMEPTHVRINEIVATALRCEFSSNDPRIAECSRGPNRAEGETINSGFHSKKNVETSLIASYVNGSPRDRVEARLLIDIHSDALDEKRSLSELNEWIFRRSWQFKLSECRAE